MTIAWSHRSVELLHDATQASLQGISGRPHTSDEAVILVAVSAFLVSAVGGFIGGAVWPYLEARRRTVADEQRPEQSAVARPSDALVPRTDRST